MLVKDSLWGFALVMLVAGPLIGFSSAIIGFTAWTVIVPMALVTLDYDVFEALFFSMVLDLCDSIVLVALMSRRNMVYWKYSFWMGLVITGSATITCITFARKFLRENESTLKTSVPYAVIVFGVFFCIKGFVLMRLRARSLRSVRSSSDPLIPLPPASPPSSQTAPKETDELAASAIPWADLPWPRRTVLLAACAAIGGASGFMGMSGAMMMVAVLAATTHMNALPATATAAAACGSSMLVMVILFLSYDLLSLPHVLIHVLIAVAFTMTGVVGGVVLTAHITRKFLLMFMIGGTLLGMSTLIILNSHFLQ